MRRRGENRAFRCVGPSGGVDQDQRNGRKGRKKERKVEHTKKSAFDLFSVLCIFLRPLRSFL